MDVVMARMLVALVLEVMGAQCKRKDLIQITVQLLSILTSYMANSLVLVWEIVNTLKRNNSMMSFS